MRPVKRGDYYQPDHGEVVNIRVKDKDHYVVVVLGESQGSCHGCPLRKELCEDWLDIPIPHRLTPVEEVVE